MNVGRNVAIMLGVIGLAFAMVLWIREARISQSVERTAAISQLEAWFETVRPELVKILDEEFPDAWASGRNWEAATTQRGEMFTIQLSATRAEPAAAFDTRFSTVLDDSGDPGPVRIEFHSTLGPEEKALEDRWLAILEGTGISVERP